MTEHAPAALHPDHAGLPALYMAELSVHRERWQLIVVAPGPEVVVDTLDLGPADTFAVPDPNSPGHHLVAASPEPRPVPPLKEAISLLPAVGYTIDPAARADPARLTGWTQVTSTCWTAPCLPAASAAQWL
ncbi:hypothetical protein [Kitasatospora sp. NPDC088783]|uniref:hypothetical protein n=1 Tax=Kitasatospora sp. NPDC088783 TaxID=3364077 RepID=UPI00381987C7